MTVTNILADDKKTWEQKAMEIKAAYDKVVMENSWLRTKTTKMEAQLVLWFGRLGDNG